MAEAFFRGVLCNVLVCMAVWMALAGRSVTDKVVAIVFPITAFVAAGFEHSIANMYFFPLAMLLGAPLGVRPTWLRNLRAGDRRQHRRRQRAGGAGVLGDLPAAAGVSIARRSQQARGQGAQPSIRTGDHR